MKCSSNCGITSDGGMLFSSIVQREVDISKKAWEFSPRTIAYNIRDTYAVVVSEKMDVPIYSIISKLDDISLEVLIDYILEALTTLHSNGIIHGDPHYKNIMLSGYDKNFWKKFKSKNVSQEISKEFVKRLRIWRDKNKIY